MQTEAIYNDSSRHTYDTLNSWLCLTVWLRAPIRSSLPYTFSPATRDASCSFPPAWSLREETGKEGGGEETGEGGGEETGEEGRGRETTQSIATSPSGMHICCSQLRELSFVDFIIQINTSHDPPVMVGSEHSSELHTTALHFRHNLKQHKYTSIHTCR